MPEFVHLHTHSDFSLLDGAATVSSLASKAKSLGMKHLALTDHGNMFGVPKFNSVCLEQGITPIIGIETYLAPGSRHNKSGSEKDVRYRHLVLLAMDTTGYHNLLKLSSLGYTEGFYYRPRIDAELLQNHADGLVCLTSCLAGEIPSLIIDGRTEEAEARAGWYRDIFPNNRFYLELQDHGIPEQKRVNKELLHISSRNRIPVVATNDVHYTNKNDARAQDILLCIGTNRKVTEKNRMTFAFPEFYFKSSDEMSAVFGEIPESLKNTLAIAEMCQLEVPQPGPVFPEYKVPDGFTVETYLEDISFKGLADRYTAVTEDIDKRLRYELSVICQMGFAGYFLVTWDFVDFARREGISVGPGRGSGAGSLVAYCLKITDIDPLKYDLIFERFLTPERVSLPDFDIDFCFERRGEVIEYITRKYGKDRVGQIITFGSLKAKAAIRDVARVLDYPYAEADRIAKLIPEGPKVTLAQALENEPALKSLQEQSEKNRELFEICAKLEGMSRHASTHAAGIVIGREVLTNYVPLYRDPRTESITTQYTWEYLEDYGLVKMDILGLKTLTIIEKTCRMLREHGISIDISSIPEDDEKTFALLGQGKSTCVFQFESTGMQAILKRAKPDKIQDLIALNSLYRPGPIENIDQYIDSKTGKKAITYPLPELKPTLEETYGVIIYQEQVMQIARVVAGYSLGQADILRRAMGKKKPEMMKEERKVFIEGALRNGKSQKKAAEIFDLLIPFAGYGFSKLHSAPYSLLAYRTAYLKAQYPAEFMAANLTSEINDTKKMAQYMSEARGMGIEIMPPDINLSEKDFTVRDGKIVYGLCGVKNVGAGAVDAILAERENGGSYSTIQNFIERVAHKDVNRKVLEALILCGVLDRFGDSRATLFHSLDRLIELAAQQKERNAFGQESLFDNKQLKQLESFELEKVEEWPRTELLRLEKQNLGFFFSGHPLEEYRKLIETHVDLDLSDPDSLQSGRTYLCIGIFKEFKEILTKNGKKMAFGTLEDSSASIETVIFPSVYEKGRELLVEGAVVAVRGKIDKARGDAKLLVDDLYSPDSLPEKRNIAVHIRLSKECLDENSICDLREFLLDQSGECPVYFHMNGNNGRDETIVRASSSIRVREDSEFVDRLKAHTFVTQVWKE